MRLVSAKQLVERQDGVWKVKYSNIKVGGLAFLCSAFDPYNLGVRVGECNNMTDIDELLQNLSTLSEDELEAQLGARAQTIGEEATRGGAESASIDSIDPNAPVPRGLMDDALVAGQRLFNWISPAAYKLLCTPMGEGSSDQTMQELVQLLDQDLEKNLAKAAGMLAPFLTANLGLAPAIAALVSTLIIKRVSKEVSKFTCDAWQKTLPATE